MASRTISHRTKYARAFSLLEILVVVGILGILGAFTAAISYDSYRAGALHGEERILVSALQKARAASLNNIDQSTHGVAVYPAAHPAAYVVFQGTSYATADHTEDEVIESLYPVTVSPAGVEVVFTQLSGVSSLDGTITITDPVRGISTHVTVNHEGRIAR